MTFYSVIFVTPTSEDWVAAYVPATTRIVETHGGRYLARTPEHAQLEGAPEAAGLRVIIEWPSKQAALDFMADPEYAPLLAARQNGSKSIHFLIEGRDALV